MKIFIAAIFLLFSLFSVSSAFAKDYFFGMGYHLAEYNDSAFSDIQPASVHVKLSKFIRSNFSIQAQFLMNAKSDTKKVMTNVGLVDFEFSLEQAFSLYAKQDFNLPFARSVNFYSLAGISDNEVQVSIPGTGSGGSLKDAGFAFGFGFERKLVDRNFLYLEYLSYPGDENYDLTGMSIGMGKRF